MAAGKDAEGAEGLLLRALEVMGEGVMFVGAHPDDETVGLGGHLPKLSRATVVIVTDGAPRDLRDAKTVGFDTAEAYAATRHAELLEAVKLAGIGPRNVVTFGTPDQQVIFNLLGVSRHLADLFRVRKPWVVFTHAYEGGHPDHDAVAFAVHAACRLMAEGEVPPPDIIEVPFYRLGSDGAVTQSFEPGTLPAPHTVRLTEAELALKEAMLAQHASQKALFLDASAGYRRRDESFRLAPSYDFRALRNAGRINYENWQLGITGAGWLEQAGKALAELGLTP